MDSIFSANSNLEGQPILQENLKTLFKDIVDLDHLMKGGSFDDNQSNLTVSVNSDDDSKDAIENQGYHEEVGNLFKRLDTIKQQIKKKNELQQSLDAGNSKNISKNDGESLFSRISRLSNKINHQVDDFYGIVRNIQNKMSTNEDFVDKRDSTLDFSQNSFQSQIFIGDDDPFQIKGIEELTKKGENLQENTLTQSEVGDINQNKINKSQTPMKKQQWKDKNSKRMKTILDSLYENINILKQRVLTDGIVEEKYQSGDKNILLSGSEMSIKDEESLNNSQLRNENRDIMKGVKKLEIKMRGNENGHSESLSLSERSIISSQNTDSSIFNSKMNENNSSTKKEKLYKSSKNKDSNLIRSQQFKNSKQEANSDISLESDSSRQTHEMKSILDKQYKAIKKADKNIKGAILTQIITTASHNDSQLSLSRVSLKSKTTISSRNPKKTVKDLSLNSSDDRFSRNSLDTSNKNITNQYIQTSYGMIKRFKTKIRSKNTPTKQQSQISESELSLKSDNQSLNSLSNQELISIDNSQLDDYSEQIKSQYNSLNKMKEQLINEGNDKSVISRSQYSQKSESQKNTIRESDGDSIQQSKLEDQSEYISAQYSSLNKMKDQMVGSNPEQGSELSQSQRSLKSSTQKSEMIESVDSSIQQSDLEDYSNQIESQFNSLSKMKEKISNQKDDQSMISQSQLSMKSENKISEKSIRVRSSIQQSQLEDYSDQVSSQYNSLNEIKKKLKDYQEEKQDNQSLVFQSQISLKSQSEQPIKEVNQYKERQTQKRVEKQKETQLFYIGLNKMSESESKESDKSDSIHNNQPNEITYFIEDSYIDDHSDKLASQFNGINKITQQMISTPQNQRSIISQSQVSLKLSSHQSESLEQSQLNDFSNQVHSNLAGIRKMKQKIENKDKDNESESVLQQSKQSILSESLQSVGQSQLGDLSEQVTSNYNSLNRIKEDLVPKEEQQSVVSQSQLSDQSESDSVSAVGEMNTQYSSIEQMREQMVKEKGGDQTVISESRLSDQSMEEGSVVDSVEDSQLGDCTEQMNTQYSSIDQMKEQMTKKKGEEESVVSQSQISQKSISQQSKNIEAAQLSPKQSDLEDYSELVSSQYQSLNKVKEQLNKDKGDQQSIISQSEVSQHSVSKISLSAKSTPVSENQSQLGDYSEKITSQFDSLNKMKDNLQKNDTPNQSLISQSDLSKQSLTESAQSQPSSIKQSQIKDFSGNATSQYNSLNKMKESMQKKEEDKESIISQSQISQQSNSKYSKSAQSITKSNQYSQLDDFSKHLSTQYDGINEITDKLDENQIRKQSEISSSQISKNTQSKISGDVSISPQQSEIDDFSNKLESQYKSINKMKEDIMLKKNAENSVLSQSRFTKKSHSEISGDPLTESLTDHQSQLDDYSGYVSNKYDSLNKMREELLGNQEGQQSEVSQSQISHKSQSDFSKAVQSIHLSIQQSELEDYSENVNSQYTSLNKIKDQLIRKKKESDYSVISQTENSKNSRSKLSDSRISSQQSKLEDYSGKVNSQFNSINDLKESMKKRQDENVSMISQSQISNKSNSEQHKIVNEESINLSVHQSDLQDFSEQVTAQYNSIEQIQTKLNNPQSVQSVVSQSQLSHNSDSHSSTQLSPQQSDLGDHQSQLTNQYGSLNKMNEQMTGQNPEEEESILSQSRVSLKSETKNSQKIESDGHSIQQSQLEDYSGQMDSQYNSMKQMKEKMTGQKKEEGESMISQSVLTKQSQRVSSEDLSEQQSEVGDYTDQLASQYNSLNKKKQDMKTDQREQPSIKSQSELSLKSGSQISQNKESLQNSSQQSQLGDYSEQIDSQYTSLNKIKQKMTIKQAQSQSNNSESQLSKESQKSQSQDINISQISNPQSDLEDQSQLIDMKYRSLNKIQGELKNKEQQSSVLSQSQQSLKSQSRHSNKSKSQQFSAEKSELNDYSDQLTSKFDIIRRIDNALKNRTRRQPSLKSNSKISEKSNSVSSVSINSMRSSINQSELEEFSDEVNNQYSSLERMNKNLIIKKKQEPSIISQSQISVRSFSDQSETLKSINEPMNQSQLEDYSEQINSQYSSLKKMGNELLKNKGVQESQISESQLSDKIFNIKLGDDQSETLSTEQSQLQDYSEKISFQYNSLNKMKEQLLSKRENQEQSIESQSQLSHKSSNNQSASQISQQESLQQSEIQDYSEYMSSKYNTMNKMKEQLLNEDEFQSVVSQSQISQKSNSQKSLGVQNIHLSVQQSELEDYSQQVTSQYDSLNQMKDKISQRKGQERDMSVKSESKSSIKSKTQISQYEPSIPESLKQSELGDFSDNITSQYNSLNQMKEQFDKNKLNDESMVSQSQISGKSQSEISSGKLSVTESIQLSHLEDYSGEINTQYNSLNKMKDQMKEVNREDQSNVSQSQMSIKSQSIHSQDKKSSEGSVSQSQLEDFTDQISTNYGSLNKMQDQMTKRKEDNQSVISQSQLSVKSETEHSHKENSLEESVHQSQLEDYSQQINSNYQSLAKMKDELLRKEDDRVSNISQSQISIKSQSKQSNAVKSIRLSVQDSNIKDFTYQMESNYDSINNMKEQMTSNRDNKDSLISQSQISLRSDSDNSNKQEDLTELVKQSQLEDYSEQTTAQYNSISKMQKKMASHKEDQQSVLSQSQLSNKSRIEHSESIISDHQSQLDDYSQQMSSHYNSISKVKDKMKDQDEQRSILSNSQLSDTSIKSKSETKEKLEDTLDQSELENYSEYIKSNYNSLNKMREQLNKPREDQESIVSQSQVSLLSKSDQFYVEDKIPFSSQDSILQDFTEQVNSKYDSLENMKKEMIKKNVPEHSVISQSHLTKISHLENSDGVESIELSVQQSQLEDYSGYVSSQYNSLNKMKDKLNQKEKQHESAISQSQFSKKSESKKSEQIDEISQSFQQSQLKDYSEQMNAQYSSLNKTREQMTKQIGENQSEISQSQLSAKSAKVEYLNEESINLSVHQSDLQDFSEQVTAQYNSIEQIQTKLNNPQSVQSVVSQSQLSHNSDSHSSTQLSPQQSDLGDHQSQLTNQYGSLSKMNEQMMGQNPEEEESMISQSVLTKQSQRVSSEDLSEQQSEVGDYTDQLASQYNSLNKKKQDMKTDQREQPSIKSQSELSLKSKSENSQSLKSGSQSSQQSQLEDYSEQIDSQFSKVNILQRKMNANQENHESKISNSTLSQKSDSIQSNKDDSVPDSIHESNIEDFSKEINSKYNSLTKMREQISKTKQTNQSVVSQSILSQKSNTQNSDNEYLIEQSQMEDYSDQVNSQYNSLNKIKEKMSMKENNESMISQSRISQKSLSQKSDQDLIQQSDLEDYSDQISSQYNSLNKLKEDLIKGSEIEQSIISKSRISEKVESFQGSIEQSELEDYSEEINVNFNDLNKLKEEMTKGRKWDESVISQTQPSYKSISVQSDIDLSLDSSIKSSNLDLFSEQIENQYNILDKVKKEMKNKEEISSVISQSQRSENSMTEESVNQLSETKSVQQSEIGDLSNQLNSGLKNLNLMKEQMKNQPEDAQSTLSQSQITSISFSEQSEEIKTINSSINQSEIGDCLDQTTAQYKNINTLREGLKSRQNIAQSELSQSNLSLKSSSKSTIHDESPPLSIDKSQLQDYSKLVTSQYNKINQMNENLNQRKSPNQSELSHSQMSLKSKTQHSLSKQSADESQIQDFSEELNQTYNSINRMGDTFKQKDKNQSKISESQKSIKSETFPNKSVQHSQGSQNDSELTDKNDLMISKFNILNEIGDSMKKNKNYNHSLMSQSQLSQKSKSEISEPGEPPSQSFGQESQLEDCTDLINTNYDSLQQIGQTIKQDKNNFDESVLSQSGISVKSQSDQSIEDIKSQSYSISQLEMDPYRNKISLEYQKLSRIKDKIGQSKPDNFQSIISLSELSQKSISDISIEQSQQSDLSDQKDIVNKKIENLNSLGDAMKKQKDDTGSMISQSQLSVKSQSIPESRSQSNLEDNIEPVDKEQSLEDSEIGSFKQGIQEGYSKINDFNSSMKVNAFNNEDSRSRLSQSEMSLKSQSDNLSLSDINSKVDNSELVNVFEPINALKSSMIKQETPINDSMISKDSRSQKSKGLVKLQASVISYSQKTLQSETMKKDVEGNYKNVTELEDKLKRMNLEQSQLSQSEISQKSLNSSIQNTVRSKNVEENSKNDLGNREIIESQFTRKSLDNKDYPNQMFGGYSRIKKFNENVKNNPTLSQSCISQTVKSQYSSGNTEKSDLEIKNESIKLNEISNNELKDSNIHSDTHSMKNEAKITKNIQEHNQLSSEKDIESQRERSARLALSKTSMSTKTIPDMRPDLSKTYAGIKKIQGGMGDKERPLSNSGISESVKSFDSIESEQSTNDYTDGNIASTLEKGREEHVQDNYPILNEENLSNLGKSDLEEANSEAFTKKHEESQIIVKDEPLDVVEITNEVEDVPDDLECLGIIELIVIEPENSMTKIEQIEIDSIERVCTDKDTQQNLEDKLVDNAQNNTEQSQVGNQNNQSVKNKDSIQESSPKNNSISHGGSLTESELQNNAQIHDKNVSNINEVGNKILNTKNPQNESTISESVLSIKSTTEPESKEGSIKESIQSLVSIKDNEIQENLASVLESGYTRGTLNNDNSGELKNDLDKGLDDVKRLGKMIKKVTFKDNESQALSESVQDSHLVTNSAQTISEKQSQFEDPTQSQQFNETTNYGEFDYAPIMENINVENKSMNQSINKEEIQPTRTEIRPEKSKESNFTKNTLNMNQKEGLRNDTNDIYQGISQFKDQIGDNNLEQSQQISESGVSIRSKSNITSSEFSKSRKQSNLTINTSQEPSNQNLSAKMRISGQTMKSSKQIGNSEPKKELSIGQSLKQINYEDKDKGDDQLDILSNESSQDATMSGVDTPKGYKNIQRQMTDALDKQKEEQNETGTVPQIDILAQKIPGSGDAALLIGNMIQKTKDVDPEIFKQYLDSRDNQLEGFKVEINLTDLEEKEWKFLDPDFQPSFESVFKDHDNTVRKYKEAYLEWRRLSYLKTFETFRLPDKNESLCSSNCKSFNCETMLIFYSSLVESGFVFSNILPESRTLINEKESSHRFVLGDYEVIIDDFVPISVKSISEEPRDIPDDLSFLYDDREVHFMDNSFENGSCFSSLFEKALAKLVGSYQQLYEVKLETLYELMGLSAQIVLDQQIGQGNLSIVLQEMLKADLEFGQFLVIIAENSGREEKEDIEYIFVEFGDNKMEIMVTSTPKMNGSYFNLSSNSSKRVQKKFITDSNAKLDSGEDLLSLFGNLDQSTRIKAFQVSKGASITYQYQNLIQKSTKNNSFGLNLSIEEENTQIFLKYKDSPILQSELVLLTKTDQISFQNHELVTGSLWTKLNNMESYLKVILVKGDYQISFIQSEIKEDDEMRVEKVQDLQIESTSQNIKIRELESEPIDPKALLSSIIPYQNEPNLDLEWYKSSYQLEINSRLTIDRYTPANSENLGSKKLKLSKKLPFNMVLGALKTDQEREFSLNMIESSPEILIIHQSKEQ